MKFSDKANIAKTFLLGGLILTNLYSCSSDNDTTEPVVYSKYISEVLDYMPAPGQFTNDLPKYNTGDTKKDMIQKANDAIAKGANGMIHLGGFGGYVTFRFDHTVANGEGADFKILGNTFTGSSEPGIIMVAWDKNKNGKPDEDEWYEIAGSEYFKDTTIKNYSITYYKPDESKTPVKGSANWQTDTEYIRWEDNQGNKGYLTKNSFHKQSYYPMWLGESSITFKGTKIADNFKQNNGIWSSVPFEFGYADNAINDSDASNIDISWAVDKNGKYVKLPGIDFVKVYSAIRQENGMLGEVSTEVTGAYDLRIK